MGKCCFALIVGILSVLPLAAAEPPAEKVLLEDGFDGLRSGPMFSVVGAHAEYHYLPEIAPKGNWAVTTFNSDAPSQLAWNVRRESGDAVMVQQYDSKSTAKKSRHTHPMLVAGDELWSDYTLTVRFAADHKDKQCGVIFRYQTDRSYYFFGVRGDEAILKRVNNEKEYHVPEEAVLAHAKFAWKPGVYMTARVALQGARIRADLDGKVVLEADDSTWTSGKVALTSDGPARFTEVRVTCTAAEEARFQAAKAKREAELARLQAENPKPVVWKKINIEGFGVGRNLRFGDLDGDGRTDILIGQVVHHGPKDKNSELSCLTAVNLDGKVLWQIGTPDAWKDHLTNDVGFQIHDIDGDGKNEVIYCMHFEIVVADGATGKTRYKAATPETSQSEARYPQILGDSLYFCDLRGTGRAADLILKDRYWQIWALNDRLQTMWTAKCNTGHYPFAKDIDGDGKDELAVGYSLFDHDGKRLWTLDKELNDHADGVAIVQLREGQKPLIVNAASDEGMVLIGLDGKIIKHLRLGHVQNPGIADFRPDLPGLEIVSINFWGNQGILHFYDAQGNLYHECEPNQFGSLCQPVNWTGKPGEFFVHSPNVDLGGMFDGWGRCVVKFPDDGHPDMCNAVLDLTGDCRDEVVVWDPHALWVYTQDDNPKKGRLYKPIRNPLYNESNYRAVVSLPGWEGSEKSEE